MNHDCPTCGDTFRTGVRAQVLDAAGEIRSRLVCQKCARRAISIVIPTVQTESCSACKTRPATVCGDCSNKAAHGAAATILKPFADHIRGKAAGYAMANTKGDAEEKAFTRGRAEGLKQAADILDNGGAVPLTNGKLLAARDRFGAGEERGA